MKRNMARKRQLDELKQEKKRKIVRDFYGYTEENHNWMAQPHRLSKGKIHCSCPMCAAKTNARRGTYVHGWKAADKRKLYDLSEALIEEYKEAYIELAK